MTGFTEKLHDTWMLIKTDRRIWSAFGFVVISLSIWSLTSVWRNNVAPSDVHKGKPPEEPGHRQSMIEFQQEWQDEMTRRKVFKESLGRAISGIEVDKEQIEWNANRLVDKLNGMTIKVDQIIAEIGQTRLDKAKNNDRIAKQKSKTTKKVIAIDRSELDMAR